MSETLKYMEWQRLDSFLLLYSTRPMFILEKRNTSQKLYPYNVPDEEKHSR